MISLSSIFQMRHGLSKKKDGMPKKHDPKKKGTHEGPSDKKFGHMKVQEKNKI